MSKIRLFFKETLEEKKQIELNDESVHYLSNVMRCEIGSIINLFNEGSGEFESKVIEKTKKKIILEVVKKIEYEKITNNFDLVFCPPKSNKLDTLIQKCTEIGVKSFIPIISDHTVNRKLNLERIKKIIKEAVEQSNQVHLPEIHSPISFDQYISSLDKNDDIFFADIQSDIHLSNFKINFSKKNSIVVGPEGDFSVNEIEILKGKNFIKSFSLGKRILRSETAAIASLVLFNNLIN